MNLAKSIPFFIKNPRKIVGAFFSRLPYFEFTRLVGYQCGASFERWFEQKILSSDASRKKAYFPIHPNSLVTNIENLYIGIDAYPVMHGCYIQAMGGIYIGDYTQIAPNVIIISANHELHDTRIHIKKRVIIGKYSWIGGNSSIMPGVELGDFTIVGAGSVVTKSFPEGHCVIGGNPAKIIKYLDKEKCLPFKATVEYNGFIKSDKFIAYAQKNLKILDIFSDKF